MGAGPIASGRRRRRVDTGAAESGEGDRRSVVGRGGLGMGLVDIERENRQKYLGGGAALDAAATGFELSTRDTGPGKTFTPTSPPSSSLRVSDTPLLPLALAGALPRSLCVCVCECVAHRCVCVCVCTSYAHR